MATFNQQQINSILDNRPSGVKPQEVLSELIKRGHEIEGVNTRSAKNLIEVKEDVDRGIADPEMAFRKFRAEEESRSDLSEDIKGTGIGIAQAFSDQQQEIRDIEQDVASGELGVGRGFLRQVGASARGIGRAIGSGVVGLGRTLLPESTEKAIESAVQRVGRGAQRTFDLVPEDAPIKLAISDIQEFAENNPVIAQDIKDLLSAGELVTGAAGAGAAAKAAIPALKRATFDLPDSDGLANSIADSISNDNKTIIQIANDFDLEPEVINKAIDPTRLTKKEIDAGITPSIKRQIQGKADELDLYFEQARKNNLDNRELSPIAFGAERANEIVEEIQDKLRDTGSQIGKDRQKVASVKVPVDDVQKIIDDFDTDLKVAGLQVGNQGVLTQAGGRTTSLTPTEIKKLTEFRGDLLALKADPRTQRLIDVRDKFDNQINFAKSAREVSNQLDPFARKVRANVAEINRGVLGAEKSAQLERFSELATFIDDWNKTAGRQGERTELFLRRLLSSKDRLNKDLVELIEKETGKDLLDVAQFSHIATEVLGGPSSQSLLRQQITNSNLDVVDLLQTNVAGLVMKVTKNLNNNFPIIPFTDANRARKQGVPVSQIHAENVAEVMLETARAVE